ncbi:MAG TPA: CusA/CzcA family heavy metal efflux RND transporter, partial [Gemmataceae bacterium]|nr:CusA/CzcA family heavy metal efflux RND transporter [Gemmataceae bacterium]
NVRIQPVYDRTELIDHVIDTVRSNLFEGGLFVIVILFAFLGNLRAAAIVALAIPLSMLFAFCGMLRFGIAASLLSLGAIDFGLIVDSSVVMIENCVRHIKHGAAGKTRLELVRDAAVEVRKPTMFGELIIMVVYLPILTLEGTSGKLFRPMALTVIFALIGSMILSMTLMPVLASLLLPRKVEEREPLLMRIAHAVHGPILRFSMRFQGFVIGFALLVLTAAGLVAWNLGADYLPRLSEGAIVIGISRLPGTELEESIRYNTQMEKAILAAFPGQVEHVWSRIGTAEVATDPMGVELTDMFVTLKHRDLWPKDGPKTQAELTEQLEKMLRDLPGQRLEYSQPIEQRLAEMGTGIRSDVGIKLFGDDFDVLTKTAKRIEEVVRDVDGVKDLAVEQIQGQPVLQVRVKQEAIARYGVSATAVLDLVESVGSKPLGEVVEGQIRFPLVVRLPEKHRRSSEAISQILVPTATGERIPLSRLADVEVTEGPSTITRDEGQRRISITCNVRRRDLASFVAEAQRRVAAEVAMPPGRYHLAWEGQYERLISATERLIASWVITVLLVVAILGFVYRNVVDVMRVLTGIPFACAGGVFALWLRDMPFSLPAAVGFIALSGVAVLDGMILVSYVRQLRQKGLALDDAVQQAAITRLRPVLMTTLVASLGFLPMALSTGMGSEVQRPLATVVIGGVLGAMVMSLLVLRVLYVAFGRFTEPRPG